MNQSPVLTVDDVFRYHGSVLFGLNVRKADPEPITIGCSIRCLSEEIIDVPSRQLKASGLVLFHLKAPAACQNPRHYSEGWSGDIRFALWQDDSFQQRLADTGWLPWSAPWLIGSGTAALEMQDEELERKYRGRAEEWSFRADAAR